MNEERSVIFMESLESILGCNWSKMEEIASWTEEDGRGGSGVFFLPLGSDSTLLRVGSPSSWSSGAAQVIFKY